MPPSQEDDRYGKALRQLARVREDQWAAERDQELLARLRKQLTEHEAVPNGQPAPMTSLFKRIMCPTDFEDTSLKALQLARQLAIQNSAMLYLVYVAPAISSPDAKEAEQLATQLLRSTADQQLAGTKYEAMVATGDAAAKILELAHALESDLIVMGTHGRRGLSRVFLGSVAERVLREAHCPVLMVRPD